MHRRVHELVENFSNMLKDELQRIASQKCKSASPLLADSVNYCLSNPGKCLRAFLASSSAEIFGVSVKRTVPLGAAIEVFHTYSLVHDDLPSMDNATMRRRKNSCHREYGEAIALLSGDAMLTLAFELLATMDESHSIKCELVELFARACGCRGMIAGQALDIQEHREFSLELIKQIHSLKTACLFSAACESGAILAGASLDERKALSSYGLALGHAFQAKDDLCDTNEDEKSPNIVRILGTERTNEYVKDLSRQCQGCLDNIKDADVSVLRELVTFVENLNL